MYRFLLSFGLALLGAAFAEATPPKLSLLFLGGKEGHQPASRFQQLEPVLAKRGIQLVYTDNLDDINLANLNKYDGLMIYANQGKGKPEQVQAILDYVASGKGFVPLHCASYCFIDDQKYVDLVGAQFRSHTTGVFRTEATAADHPIMKGVQGFESWDETYVHHKHNEKDRTVLEVRADRDLKEPWTWVRTHGKGRVFYTAWGHDHRTWSHEGFQTLVERGTRWACGQDLAEATTYIDAPKMTAITAPKSDFEMIPAKVPFYPKSDKWGVTADPITTMQKPLAAEQSVQHYSMPEGFTMQLFASDEQFGGKPLAMTWDERGRLWVSVTKDYPNELQREGAGRDKIIILEDTDGDGKADKVTTFAEKLSIPTSLLCVHGGLIVHQAPHTLFLKDTDGDGKADVRQVLLTGWATNDTHAGPSNLRYGFDNWIYGMVGYSGFTGTVNGEKLNFRQGLYRFQLQANPNPDQAAPLILSKLELLRNVNNNAWGVAFNEDGDLFGSTANGCPLVYAAIPNRYYEKVRGLTPGVLANIALNNQYHPITNKVRQVDWHGGFTSAAGCAIYTARNYPPEYWNRTAFVSDPTGHLTAAFVLQPNGTDYVARYGWNLIAADDEWAAPIDAQVGPDGNVWILDWYNFIVQHNPTPQGFQTGKGNAYETDVRDKTRGRVYRVVYTKAQETKLPNLTNPKPETWVETLKSDNLFWRLQAQRKLVENGDKTTAAMLNKLIATPDANPLAAIHALWALDGLKIRGELPVGLNAKSAAVRRAVLRTLPNAATSVDAILAAGLLDDADAGVRLAALLALADQPSTATAGTELAKRILTLNATTERGLADATLVACVAHAAPVLQALATTPNKAWSRESLAVVERIAASYATTVPNDLGKMLSAIQNSAVSDAIVSGLATGWPKSKTPKLSAEDDKAMVLALASASPTARGKLLRLASSWGVKGLDAQLRELSKGLLATIADEKASAADRISAAKQAVEYLPADEDVAQQLVSGIGAKATPELVAGLLEALAGSKAKVAGPALVAKLPTLPPTLRPIALRVILARPEPTQAFLEAVEKGTLRFDMLELDQKTALAAHPNNELAERAKKLLAMGGGLPDADRQKVIDQFQDVLTKTGEVAGGKKAFTTHCAKCHKHGGEGAQIGPDLTGFAVHPKEEILIHVLDPSRSVEGNYKAYTARLLDGRVVTGLLSSQTKTTVELLDAENKKQSFNTSDLDELTESKKSLMPEGFEKQMTKAEITDLLEFLTLKGKYVPIPLDKLATINSTRGMFFDANGVPERLVFPDWKPKEFNGVPFHLVDPASETVKNMVMFRGTHGDKPPKMPRSVVLPCNTAVKTIHMLGGIGGWSFPASEKGTVSLVIRLTYTDGKTEEHELKNGLHFADYIRKVEVPESKHAFTMTGNQQVRYLSVTPKRTEVIKQIEFVKGPDETAPILVSVTVETP
jgi:uncharacterized protein